MTNMWTITVVAVAIVALLTCIVLWIKNANLKVDLKNSRNELAILRKSSKVVRSQPLAVQPALLAEVPVMPTAQPPHIIPLDLQPVTESAGEESRQLEAIVEGWNHLAADASAEERSAFVERFAAQGVDRSAAIHGSADFLWWFASPGTSEGIILPGWKPLRDWQKSYRGLMGEAARAELGDWYDIHPGDVPRISRPAVGSIGPDSRVMCTIRGAMVGA